MVLFIDLIMLGCGGRKSEDRPQPLLDSIPITIPLSTFNLPVSYSIRSLESFLNQKIQGDFLKTIIRPEGKEKLEIKVEMSKLKKITLERHGQVLVCKVPLQAVPTILHSGVNIITKGIKPVETEVLLELRTPASLDSKWLMWNPEEPRFRVATILHIVHSYFSTLSNKFVF